MLRTLTALLACTAGAVLGALTCWAGLLRLGWRRHGASPLDLSFLHLDWVLDPSLPAWRAHVGNLAFLAIGLLLVIGSLAAARLALHAGWGRGRGG